MLYSLIPRGVRRFFFNAATSAKPISDQYVMHLTATLPVNFAHIFSRFNLQISADTLSDWDADGFLRLINHIQGQEIGVTEQMSFKTNLLTLGGASPARVTDASSPRALAGFIAPFWSIGSAGVDMRVSMSNQASPAQAAGFLIAHAEFLEYDLTQAQRYFINTPIPVLAR